MGFVYLTQATVVRGADACSFTNNFVAECGTSISLTGASQVAKITNNYLISAWAGYSVFAENAEGILISGNTILWACSITLINPGCGASVQHDLVGAVFGRERLQRTCHRSLAHAVTGWDRDLCGATPRPPIAATRHRSSLNRGLVPGVMAG
jgi:hypothetical protein